MRIVKAFPPMWTEINRAFNVRGKPVIFCFGDTIYNPTGGKIDDTLLRHEEVHSRQQNGKPLLWWDRYIASPHFRFEMELPAHQAEVRAGGDRAQIARRLASPLYGNLITFERAMELLTFSF
jgi:hypothetical protein